MTVAPIIPAGVVRTSALVIDLDALTVHVDGREVALTAIEREIVLLLAGRAGQIVPAREVVAAVWGEEFVIGSLTAYGESLRVHACRLRGKLGAAGALVETVFGFGYRLRVMP